MRNTLNNKILNNIIGCFIVYRQTNKNKSFLLFYSISSNSILYYSYFEPLHSFKQFNIFISECISNLNLEYNIKERYIIFPPLIIRKPLINNLASYNIHAITNKGEPYLYNLNIFKIDYKTIIRDNPLDNAIDIINKELKLKEKPNLLHKKDFNPSNIKRNYSTFIRTNPKWEIKTSKLTGYKFFYFYLDNSPLSINLINTVYHIFWTKVAIPKFKENNRLKLIRLQFRVRFEDGSDRSINNLKWFKLNEMQKALDHAIDFWSDKNEDYKTIPAFSIILMYKFFNKEFEKIATPIEYKDTPKQLYSGYNLPITMDLERWGEIKHLTENRVEIKLFNSSYKARVIISPNTNIVDIHKLDERLLTFEDTKINETTFKREFNDKTFYYDNGNQVLTVEKNKCEFIKKLKPVNTFNNQKFITMDIETKSVIIDNEKIMNPICLSIYDGKNISNFGIWDYINSDEMIVEAFKSIFKRRYNGYNIYFHNLANFDAVFILKILANIKGINLKPPIIKDRRIIKIEIQYSSYKITLMDSYQIMPSSLDKLAKTFKVENKMIFPHKFVNEHPLDYKGSFPALKYFFHPDSSVNPMSFEDFLSRYTTLLSSYIHQDWILKDELIKYCNNDVVILHQIIKIFTEELYNRYKINPFKYPTLASLAFAIYRTSYMEKENIPILTGEIYEDIKKAYYGGMVEVYQPYAEKAKKYDVNSLYPDSMVKHPMPVGNPIYFEGDLSYLDGDKSMAFVHASINMPHIHKPILPKKHKIKSGVRTTIYPIGSWKGWYTIFELENARNLVGSQHKIDKGYIFDKEIIFDKYVTDLFKIKSSVSPDDPWYLISKLLLNSLYGRFGLNPDLDEHKIIEPEEYDKMLLHSINITDHQEMGDKLLIRISSKKGEGSSINSSVAVSAAIASWSRVHMTYYIVKYGDFIVYIDTDGIILTTYLDSNEVGKQLGKMKFEGEYDEGVFLGPKLYGLTNKNEMIVKVKGLKNPPTYPEMKILLYEENMEKSQEKWIRNYTEGNIKIVDEMYTISVTENKRSMIRDNRGRLISTEAFEINE